MGSILVIALLGLAEHLRKPVKMRRHPAVYRATDGRLIMNEQRKLMTPELNPRIRRLYAREQLGKNAIVHAKYLPRPLAQHQQVRGSTEFFYCVTASFCSNGRFIL